VSAQERAAEVLAEVSNVPFVGPRQKRVAQALAAAGLLADEAHDREVAGD